MNRHEEWMTIALEEADRAEKENEVPVGAVIVKNNILLSKAHNQMITLNDPSAHAEILALRKAAEVENNYRLPGVTIYTTMEPCLMCVGALLHARIKTLIFAAKDERFGGCGSVLSCHQPGMFNHSFETLSGILAKEATEKIQNFFKKKRNKP